MDISLHENKLVSLMEINKKTKILNYVHSFISLYLVFRTGLSYFYINIVNNPTFL